MRQLRGCRSAIRKVSEREKTKRKGNVAEFEYAQAAPVQDEEGVDAISCDNDQPTHFKHSTNMGVVDLGDRECAIEYSRVQIKQHLRKQEGVKCKFEVCLRRFQL